MRKIIVVTAPSGAGKTTIVRNLLQTIPYLDFSVSATTREKRINEVNGKDYHFLSIGEFKRKISENAFVEWEEVYPGSFYGTLKSELERIWADNKIAIFDIDVRGAMKIKEIYGKNVLTIFIMPPSIDTLLDRLKGRKSESDEDMLMRIEKASQEMETMNHFDEVIVNDDLQRAIGDARVLVEEFSKVKI